MKVFAKSASLMKPEQLKQHLLDCCPCRLFKHVNLVNFEGELNYCYRLPSKAKLDLNIYSPVTDDFYDHLINNELRLNTLPSQQFCIQSIRDLQQQAGTAIKEFCNGLTPEECMKFSSKINLLKDSVNNECIPHLTRTINNNWNESVRAPLFDCIDCVEL